MSVGRFIGAILGDDVEVTISPGLVIFKCNGRVKSFEPIIYIAPDSHQLIAIGTSQTPSTRHITVELFRQAGSAEISINKEDCLAMFFRYSFSKIVNRTILVRPRVRFYGADSVNQIGYPRDLLHDAVVKAGARECQFES